MQKGKILIFATIILMVFPCLLLSFSFSGPQKLNQNDTDDSYCEEPQICSDNAGNIYTCWMDDRDMPDYYSIYFRRGELKGNGSVIWYPEKEIGSFENSKYPRMTCDNSGHVYVAWIQKGLDDWSDIIFVNYSDDRGESWDYGGKRIDNHPPVPSRRVSITCDNHGHVYVVWDSKRTDKYEIYFDYSSDHGVTWHQDILLGPFGPVVGSYPEISCDEDGENVYAVWFTSTVVAFNHSSDYGATWNDFDTRISPGSTKRDRPHIVNNGHGNVYVGWIDGRQFDYSVYFNYSNDHGVTWQQYGFRISDPPEMTYAGRMALQCEHGENAGHVYVAWYDGRSGVTFDVFFDYSEDAGSSWHEDVQINSGVMTSGAISVGMDTDDAGSVYVVWNKYRDTNYPSVWMNYSMDHGLTWPLDNAQVDSEHNICYYPKVTASRLQGTTPYAAFTWRQKIRYFDVYANALKFNNSGIAVVPGPGENNRPYVRMYDGDGLLFGEDFLAYNLSGYGAEVSTGEVEADSEEAIITGPGPGVGYGPNVRGYRINGDSVTGLNFLAYGIRKYGVKVGIGDVDGDPDGAGEILTGPGPGEMFGPHVRIWKYDGEKVIPLGSGFFAYGVRKYGVGVDAGDIDGDGVDEIITAPGPGPMFGAHVKCWKYTNGTVHQIAGFMAYRTGKYGVNIGGGNVDGDDRDEILTGPGPSPAYGSHVRGWQYINGFIEDIPEINFKAYQTKGFGCKVSGGNTDLDSRDEIVTLPGPGPLFPAHLRGFNFDDGQVTPIGHLNFFAYDGATFKYGGNAAILELEDYR